MCKGPRAGKSMALWRNWRWRWVMGRAVWDGAGGGELKPQEGSWGPKQGIWNFSKGQTPMMPTSHPLSLTPSFIDSFSGQLHTQEPGFLPRACSWCCRREARSTHPKCKHTRKGQGIYAPEKSATNGDWRQRIRLCALTLPPILQGHSLNPIQPSSCGCHHASMIHIYSRFSLFSVFLYLLTSLTLIWTTIVLILSLKNILGHFKSPLAIIVRFPLSLK